MKILERLFKKKKKLIVGLMSGTSADGIDAVLVEVSGSGERTKFRQLAFETFPYPKGYKQCLMKNSDPATARLDEITRLNMFVAGMFSDAVKRIVRKGGKKLSAIDLIGSHGQTIHHLSERKKFFGRNVRASLQIGDPSAIAKLTGIITIGNFRAGDIAVGGAGAPLVPYFDYLMLRSLRRNRALLNIGGIANLTILPKKSSLDDVLAFDTGPGNMLTDALMMELYNTPFDDDGRTALHGNIIPELLRSLMAHPYIHRRPPKSTGREMFGESLLKTILKEWRRKRKQDLVTTVTEFTALSIYYNYLRFISKRTKIDELLVSGGGVHNRYIMEALKRYFAGVKVRSLQIAGVSPDAKEAICFAVLANEAISARPANVPQVTGAQRRTILGVIGLP